MSKFAELPDGTRLEFPDETADDVIDAAVQKHLGVEPEPEPRSLSERTLRGLALGARYLAETPGLTVAGLADIGSAGINKVMELRGALPGTYRLPTNRAQTIYEGFNEVGFPQPESRLEQTGERISRGVVGAAFGPATGARLATSANPVTSAVGTTLQQAPTMQGASAVTGASVGDIAERMGAGPKMQMVAEMGGAMVAPASVAAARTTAGAYRAAGAVKDTMTTTGQRRIAGDVLNRSAVDPDRAAQNLADDAAFGSGISEKATGQASRDPGLLTLERSLRNTDPDGRFGQQMSQANLRRQKILDVMGGDDIEVAKTNRQTTTSAQRDAAFESATAKPVNPVFERIDAILQSPEGTRKVVRQALNAFRRDIEGIVDEDGNVDVRRLYEIRKDVNDAMQGKFSAGERADFRLAKGQLYQVKQAIDDVIESAAPGYRKYLEDYARLSRDIDQRGTIQNIQARAKLAVSDPSSGRDILSNASFKRMVAAERENGVLTREQITVLEAIADDLDSGQAINAATVRTQGSDTAKNLTVAHVIGRATGGNADSPLMQNLARPVRWLTSLSEDQVQGILVDAMLDPKLARQLLAEARPQNIAAISTSLRDLAGVSATAGALGSASQTGEQRQ